MKRMYLLAISTITILTAMMVSCAPDPVYSEPPQYKKLFFTTTPPSAITLGNQRDIETSSICNAGDTVTAFIWTEDAGDYITSATYHWKLIGKDSTIKVIAPHQSNNPPMCTFRAPDSIGRYTISFKAKYNYSATTEQGTIFGESQSFTGELNVTRNYEK